MKNLAYSNPKLLNFLTFRKNLLQTTKISIKYQYPLQWGGCVDFLAGEVRRAPKWMQKIGLEWFFRFIQDPKRLFKRYFVDDIKIFSIAKKINEHK